MRTTHGATAPSLGSRSGAGVVPPQGRHPHCFLVQQLPAHACKPGIEFWVLCVRHEVEWKTD